MCVSLQGETKVQKGTSVCYSDTTSQAIAVNDSDAFATFGSKATATNDSAAFAFFFSEARAINDSFADARDDRTATAQNGEVVECP